MGRLTKPQFIGGDREAMTGDDGASVALQQFVCVGLVKVSVVKTTGYVQLRGDSESTKSRESYRLSDAWIEE